MQEDSQDGHQLEGSEVELQRQQRRSFASGERDERVRPTGHEVFELCFVSVGRRLRRLLAHLSPAQKLVQLDADVSRKRSLRLRIPVHVAAVVHQL